MPEVAVSSAELVVRVVSREPLLEGFAFGVRCLAEADVMEWLFAFFPHADFKQAAATGAADLP
jgi:hypothetical protein